MTAKSDSPKIGFYEVEGWEQDLVKKALPAAEISLSPAKLEELNLPVAAQNFEIISVFVNSQITEKVLALFPQLKFVTTRSTGYDHIDLKACQSRGVQVAYVPGYGDNTVAEFAFGLLLNLTRKLYEGINRVKEEGTFSFTGLRGVDLKGKTLGVVGTGRIGKESVKIAKGFGMRVIAYDPYPDEAYARKEGYEYVNFNDLLARADAITLHVPYNKNTHHLINKENIKNVKKGAYLINTARGGLVETDALVWGLQNQILSGVGLDVLEEEGEVKDELSFLERGHPNAAQLKVALENHILMKMPNVLIAPHNAFNTQEALERILNTTLLNIKGYLAGKLVNLVG